MTAEEIEAGRSEKGGFTKAQLASWGIPWPPPPGWKERLMQDGPSEPLKSPIRPDHCPHELLRKVVLAVVEKGHASDFYEFPDVLEYFGAQLPCRAEKSKDSDDE